MRGFGFRFRQFFSFSFCAFFVSVIDGKWGGMEHEGVIDGMVRATISSSGGDETGGVGRHNAFGTEIFVAVR